jgi:RNA polymerase sigma-70 factor (ECF subfamily)
MGKEEYILVRELSKGNLLAFNTLFRKYSGRLYRFAYGYLKSVEESEELVQEVFTIIWEKRAGLKEELSFKSFLFTISFNIIRKHFRTQNYLFNYLKDKLETDTDTHTSQKIIYNSLFQYITELVNKLPDRRKEIFIKSRFEGLSIKEISEDLKISHKTVENQLTIALKFIRENLTKESLRVIILIPVFLFSIFFKGI